MVPHPVALRKPFEHRHHHLEVLGKVALHLIGVKPPVLQNLSSNVPYGVEFGIEREESGGVGETGVVVLLAVVKHELSELAVGGDLRLILGFFLSEFGVGPVLTLDTVLLIS